MSEQHNSSSSNNNGTTTETMLNDVLNGEKFNVVAGSTPFVKAKENGRVYKEATKRERGFYEMLQQRSSNDAIHKLIPKFFGVHHVSQKDYIILEDLTCDYVKPCIMDIKLGLTHRDMDLDKLFPKPSDITADASLSSDTTTTTITTTTSPTASPSPSSSQSTSITSSTSCESLDRLQVRRCSIQPHEVSSYLASKYITAPRLGFCLCGFQKYNATKAEFEKFSKEQGRFLNEVTIRTTLHDFFHNGQERRTDAMSLIIQKLKYFKEYFEHNPEFKFRSSSLLLIYEGDNMLEAKCDIRLIDFAHTLAYPEHLKPYSSRLSQYTPTVDNGDNNNDDDNSFSLPVDGGYLFGISNLLSILEAL
ncbi:hypothetical protein SAMD00019534_082390 [Acytostelium subglobosum LB1]|uniref:hypothetical protein n=1 Tax=Acytostelium subglobosum LB1 TaxID=1410327 RepID=UPI00064515D8|nr:hypothetical protein SAMD00019534_082390 [Acytostelium subglobosum LB1]GAM25064.1 hypothetical protein SAMD00019534_082390 [Acytostelium subglobosum LB1]|eukprot:XP_012752153.1 hypothetical protein SAMD00019534_082390 [Acytostelium subglobosum LB1]